MTTRDCVCARAGGGKRGERGSGGILVAPSSSPPLPSAFASVAASFMMMLVYGWVGAEGEGESGGGRFSCLVNVFSRSPLQRQVENVEGLLGFPCKLELLFSQKRVRQKGQIHLASSREVERGYKFLL